MTLAEKLKSIRKQAGMSQKQLEEKLGSGTSISYEEGGRQTEWFDTPDAENIIELNGIKSEFVICMSK